MSTDGGPAAGVAPRSARRPCSTSTAKVLDTALSCSAIYGIVPTSAMTVTIMPRTALLPYLEAMKSAIEVMRWVFEMRAILRSTNHQPRKTTVGPV